MSDFYKHLMDMFSERIREDIDKIMTGGDMDLTGGGACLTPKKKVYVGVL